jgi:hypothetical protein
MPTDTLIAVTGIIAAFVAFSAVLGYAIATSS